MRVPYYRHDRQCTAHSDTSKVISLLEVMYKMLGGIETFFKLMLALKKSGLSLYSCIKGSIPD
jgi:hypothetical protein